MTGDHATREQHARRSGNHATPALGRHLSSVPRLWGRERALSHEVGASGGGTCGSVNAGIELAPLDIAPGTVESNIGLANRVAHGTELRLKRTGPFDDAGRLHRVARQRANPLFDNNLPTSVDVLWAWRIKSLCDFGVTAACSTSLRTRSHFLFASSSDSSLTAWVPLSFDPILAPYSDIRVIPVASQYVQPVLNNVTQCTSECLTTWCLAKREKMAVEV